MCVGARRLATQFGIDFSAKEREKPKWTGVFCFVFLDMVVVLVLVVVYALISDGRSLVPFVAISMTCIHFTTHFPQSFFSSISPVIFCFYWFLDF